MTDKLLRVRFKANAADFRPVKWPVKYPFWCTGFSGDGCYSIVVSYADNEQYIYDNWPEAEDIEVQQVDRIVFTDRFPKPKWFMEV